MSIQVMAVREILKANGTLFAVEICRGGYAVATGGRNRVCE